MWLKLWLWIFRNCRWIRGCTLQSLDDPPFLRRHRNQVRRAYHPYCFSHICYSGHRGSSTQRNLFHLQELHNEEEAENKELLSWFLTHCVLAQSSVPISHWRPAERWSKYWHVSLFDLLLGHSWDGLENLAKMWISTGLRWKLVFLQILNQMDQYYGNIIEVRY